MLIRNMQKVSGCISKLALQACLKKAEVKFELLTEVDMPLMVEKAIRGGM